MFKKIGKAVKGFVKGTGGILSGNAKIAGSLLTGDMGGVKDGAGRILRGTSQLPGVYGMAGQVTQGLLAKKDNQELNPDDVGNIVPSEADLERQRLQKLAQARGQSGTDAAGASTLLTNRLGQQQKSSLLSFFR